MGMAEEAGSHVDIFGIPEYFINEVSTEIIGGNVRIICGARRGRDVDWRYSVVMPAEKLMAASRQCQQAAEEAFNIGRLMLERRTGH